jgi:hypothetical protein
MAFVEITLANIKVGADVVRKDVYKSYGPKNTIVCKIEEATYNVTSGEEPFIELLVYNPRVNKAFIFRSEEYLIRAEEKPEPIDMKNPNRTFIRRKH